MNLFETPAEQEILSRLQNLTAATPAQWGQMNAAQMVAHCQAPFQTFFGEMQLKRGLIGILFGGMMKKQFLSNKPWKQNLPTAPQFKMTDKKEFEKERDKLAGYIRRFANEGSGAPTSMHPFFGRMSAQEWATLSYNHLNHHLKQFGV